MGYGPGCMLDAWGLQISLSSTSTVSIPLYGVSCCHATAQFLCLIFLSDDFYVCVQLHKSVVVTSSIYCYAFGHPFDQYEPRNVKKERQHHSFSWCFCPCFRRIRWIFVLPCQWRLLTSPYVIIAPQFVACNFVNEKHAPLFSRERFFLQVVMHAAHCSTVSVCGIPWVHIFRYFRFFNVNMFFKWVPTSKSRVTYDLDTDLDTRHRHPTPTPKRTKLLEWWGAPSTSHHITGIKMLWDSPYHRQKRVSYVLLNERMGKVVSL